MVLRDLIYHQWEFQSLENPWVTRNNEDCSYPRMKKRVMWRVSHQERRSCGALASPLEIGKCFDVGMGGKTLNRGVHIMFSLCVDLFVLN